MFAPSATFMLLTFFREPLKLRLRRGPTPQPPTIASGPLAGPLRLQIRHLREQRRRTQPSGQF
eukprot:12358287-Alexandrium_andersonii.AAC.1